MFKELSKSKFKWLKFALFPDIYKPVRMPSYLSPPTHIFKRVTYTNCKANNNKIVALSWKPRYSHDASYIHVTGPSTGIL